MNWSETSELPGVKPEVSQDVQEEAADTIEPWRQRVHMVTATMLECEVQLESAGFKYNLRDVLEMASLSLRTILTPK
jgi:hypothetical protein